MTSMERKTRLELATPTLARIAAPRSKKAPPFQTYQLSYFRRVDYQQIRGFRFIQNPIFTCMIFTRKRTGVNIGVKVQTSFAVNNSWLILCNKMFLHNRFDCQLQHLTIIQSVVIMFCSHNHTYFVNQLVVLVLISHSHTCAIFSRFFNLYTPHEITALIIKWYIMR